MNELIVWIPKNKRAYSNICGMHNTCDYQSEESKFYIQQTGVCNRHYQMLFTAAFHNGCEEAADSLRSPTSLGLWR